jgi:hypothetical protein
MRKSLRAYLECALWSSTDDTETPLDSNYGIEDIHARCIKEHDAQLADFEEANAADLEASGASPEQWGHDFWLTRNRHGAGFWDRGYGAVGERLTSAAHAYGESVAYLGDDGKVYLS